MLDTIPELLHEKVVDCCSSPKSRQNWAQVNKESRRLTQEPDAIYYRKWLRDDFARDSPVDGQPSAKDAYRAHLKASSQETARLMGLARGDEIARFTSCIADAGTQAQLSCRYGKRPVAHAGLRLAQRLAQPRNPYESPPRLREGELDGLHTATRALHDLAGTQKKEDEEASFANRLQHATEQAAHQVTRATCPGEGPPAPRRKQR